MGTACIDSQQKCGNFDTIAAELHSTWDAKCAIYGIYGEKVAQEADKAIKKHLLLLTTTRTEALLLTLFNNLEKFETPDTATSTTAIDGRVRAIRKKINESKMAKWKHVFTPLRLAAEAKHTDASTAA